MKHISTSILILLTLISCHEKPSKTTSAELNIFYEKTKRATIELSLPKIEKGVDSLEIRLWSKVEVTNGGNVLEIRKINNKWTCSDYSYIETQHIKRHEISDDISFFTNFTIDTFWVKKIEPKTGWKDFFEKLQAKKAFELPDQRTIKGWDNNVSDGISYLFEFSTKNNYRYFSYNCPDIYEKKFIECKRMTQILEIFNSEFGVFDNNGRCR